MPSWNDLGTALNTLRDIDGSVVREESEKPVTINCVGSRVIYTRAAALLRTTGSRRYGPAGLDPLVYYALPAGEPEDALRRADLLLVLLDGQEPVSAADAAALAQLGRLAMPTVIVVAGVASPGDLGAPRQEFAHARIVMLSELETPTAAETLATALLERLPGELHLAAARRLPGLRPNVARDTISSVAFTNASYALASALPEQVPILSVPFAAADILVLTKNQAMMVYRLALAHGAPPEFQARIREVLPVVGGAFAWRQIARSLIGLVPIWGIVPKVAIAYAGTYTTGVAAWRWFADSELVSGARLREISNEATRLGRERAVALIEAARAQGAASSNWLGRTLDGVRQRLPGRRRTTPLAAPGNNEQRDRPADT